MFYSSLSSGRRRRLQLTFVWRKHLQTGSCSQPSKARVSTALPFLRDKFPSGDGTRSRACFMHKVVLFFSSNNVATFGVLPAVGNKTKAANTLSLLSERQVSAA